MIKFLVSVLNNICIDLMWKLCCAFVQAMTLNIEEYYSHAWMARKKSIHTDCVSAEEMQSDFSVELIYYWNQKPHGLVTENQIATISNAGHRHIRLHKLSFTKCKSRIHNVTVICWDFFQIHLFHQSILAADVTASKVKWLKQHSGFVS